MDFLIDIYRFIKERNKIWLAPVIIALLLIAGLIAAGAGSAFAPFIYTLF